MLYTEYAYNKNNKLIYIKQNVSISIEDLTCIDNLVIGDEEQEVFYNKTDKSVIIEMYDKYTNSGRMYSRINQVESVQSFTAKSTPTTKVLYRAVPSSLVNRLVSISNRTVKDIELEPQIHALLGLDILPGGYVLQKALNKTISPENFNTEVGLKYLAKELDLTLIDRLYELEGYRLYHTLNMIDTVVRDELSGDDTVVWLIANNAVAVDVGCYTIVSANSFSYIDLNLKPGVQLIHSSTYYKLFGLLSTYILNLK